MAKPKTVAASGRPGRVENLVQWKPGQSGNPSGRPKGIASKARELVNNDPKRLLEVLLSVAEDSKAKPGDRISATREFLDRAWGRSAAYAPVEDGDPLDLSDIDRAIGSIVDDLAALRETKTANATAPGTVATDS